MRSPFSLLAAFVVLSMTPPAIADYCTKCRDADLKSKFEGHDSLDLAVHGKTRLAAKTNCPNGSAPLYYAEFQADSNLVMYGEIEGPMWSSETGGSGGRRVIIQGDANLIMVDNSSNPVW
ncbi:Aste57867_19700 [Aphanomyces stellatus]|uniref:Aste57867_19700 protein n=1 Tax=Aphanomyces stellatus TaxID=120398 RepID=A0A485LDP1_9STRA|nr:hypothetical protein As57867_019635 [Aphanomyces stellatus]VFT96400.1 Aste57867_19700 [Aphanomyces stellatus]